MAKKQNSVIDDYVASFDMQIANRRLLDHVKRTKNKHELSYGDLARGTGYSERRLKYILSEAQNPTLYRDELQILPLVSGIELDVLFGVPDLSSKRVVNREYGARNKSGKILGVDFRRSALYIRCLHMCLDQYQDRKA